MLRVEKKLPEVNGRVTVRRATARDLEAVLEIASSVGSERKDSDQGFLVDDYLNDRGAVRKKMRNALNGLQHFYMAEIAGEPVGFLMAYRKEEWLADNPEWIEAVQWHPSFQKNLLRNFAVVDKTAIRADLTGRGIGSDLYVQLIEDLKDTGIRTLLAETIIDPVPNFASLNFRKKQRYQLAGMRYEFYNSRIYTDLVYFKNLISTPSSLLLRLSSRIFLFVPSILRIYDLNLQNCRKNLNSRRISAKNREILLRTINNLQLGSIKLAKSEPNFNGPGVLRKNFNYSCFFGRIPL